MHTNYGEPTWSYQSLEAVTSHWKPTSEATQRMFLITRRSGELLRLFQTFNLWIHNTKLTCSICKCQTFTTKTNWEKPWRGRDWFFRYNQKENRWEHAKKRPFCGVFPQHFWIFVFLTTLCETTKHFVHGLKKVLPIAHPSERGGNTVLIRKKTHKRRQ